MRIHDNDKRYIIKGSPPVVLPVGYVLKYISLYGKAVTVDVEEAKMIQTLGNENVLQQVVNQINLLSWCHGGKGSISFLFSLIPEIFDLHFFVAGLAELDLECRVAGTFDELHLAACDKEKITECDFSVLLEKEENQFFCPPGLRFSAGDMNFPPGTVLYARQTQDFFLLDAYRERQYRIEQKDYHGYHAIMQPISLFKQSAGRNVWLDFSDGKRSEIKEIPFLDTSCSSFCLGRDVVVYDIYTETMRTAFHTLATKIERLAGFYRGLATIVK